MQRTRLWAGYLLLVGLHPGPALADVRDGVEAWARGEFESAVAQWRTPAEGGDADAQFNLGQAYRFGRGVPMDLAQAENWYRRAAQQGHLRAEDNLGLTLFQLKAYAEAFPLLEKSARRGDPRAQFVLGTALFNGDLIAKDWTRAYALMLRASANGLGRATSQLADMAKYVPEPQRAEAQALAQNLAAQEQRPVALAAPAPADTPLKAGPVAQPTSPPMAAPPQQEAKSAPAISRPWHVQLGAFGNVENARNFKARMQKAPSLRGAYKVTAQPRGALTLVRAGPFPNRAAAAQFCVQLRQASQSCLVTQD